MGLGCCGSCDSGLPCESLSNDRIELQALGAHQFQTVEDLDHFPGAPIGPDGFPVDTILPDPAPDVALDDRRCFLPFLQPGGAQPACYLPYRGARVDPEHFSHIQGDMLDTGDPWDGAPPPTTQDAPLDLDDGGGGLGAFWLLGGVALSSIGAFFADRYVKYTEAEQFAATESERLELERMRLNLLAECRAAVLNGQISSAECQAISGYRVGDKVSKWPINPWYLAAGGGALLLALLLVGRRRR